MRNSSIPKAINDVVLKALAADLTQRYPRASDLLADVLVDSGGLRRASAPGASSDADVAEIQLRLRPRETPQPTFCWHCRKPLQARTARCPFCRELQ